MTLYELIDTAMACQQRRADGTLAPVLARSRRAPMRSAIKRYGTFLGIDAQTAGPDSYHLPDHEIRSLVDTKMPITFAANTRRNLVNDVVALLRIGVDQGWLAPLPAPLLSWRQRLANPLRRDPSPPTERYALSLDQCPPALRDSLMAYLQWCEAPMARNRDRRIAKRPVTSAITRHTVLRLAGFAVRHLGQPIESLTLDHLCQPDFIEAYANWWLERRGRMTAGLSLSLAVTETVARHWLKDPERAKTLVQMHQSLPPVEAVRQKEHHWLSLQQLEDVGLSLHPFNARRVQEYPSLKRPSYLRKPSRSYRRTSLYIEFSLIIRLLIRLPMRQRCIREMLLGKNLYQDHAGLWRIRFVGTELKIARVNGAISRYEFPFPVDLVPYLEEWLRDWRGKLAGPDEPHVFLTSQGKPLSQGRAVSEMISRMTYRFTGISVNPHMIRDIWATEYLNRQGDVMGCARRLGNTPEVVMKHYAHIIQKDADARAESFLQGTFGRRDGK